MNPCAFVIFLSLLLAIQQHQRVRFHVCEDGSTHADFEKGPRELSKMPFNWPPNCSPCSCPSPPSMGPQYSSWSNPSKSHSERVSPLLNFSSGFGTNTTASKTLHRPPLHYLADTIFYFFLLQSTFSCHPALTEVPQQLQAHLL